VTKEPSGAAAAYEASFARWLGRLDPELALEASSSLADERVSRARLRRFAELLLPGERLDWFRFDADAFAEEVVPVIERLSPNDRSIPAQFRASAAVLAPRDAVERLLERLASVARDRSLPEDDRRALHTAALMLVVALGEPDWSPDILPPLESVFKVQLLEEVRRADGLLHEVEGMAGALREQGGMPNPDALPSGMERLVERAAASPLFRRQAEKELDAVVARVKRAARKGKLPPLVLGDEWLYLSVAVRDELNALLEIGSDADREQATPVLISLLDAIDEALDAGLRDRIRDRHFEDSQDGSLPRKERRLAGDVAMAIHAEGAMLVLDQVFTSQNIGLRDDAEEATFAQVMAGQHLAAVDLEPYAAYVEGVGEDPIWVRRAQELLEARGPLVLRRC